jgi:formamidopyrimidine-DNA glycosylase
MPELPEAEYMVRRLREYASGQEIRKTRILRRGFAAPRQAKGAITGYSRRAKNVLIHLEGGRVLRIQLGMTGHVYWVENAAAPPRFARAMFELRSGAGLVFEDSRVFGSIELHRETELGEVFRNYGPEPLDPGFTWERLREAAARSKGPIKPFLLDQSKVAGLGNIWAAESAFRARLHPAHPVNRMEDRQWKALHKAIRETLARAIDNTFKVAKRPEDFPDGDLLWLNVYGREGKPCRRCRTPVERTVQAGRSTFLCPQCQPAA